MRTVYEGDIIRQYCTSPLSQFLVELAILQTLDWTSCRWKLLFMIILETFCTEHKLPQLPLQEQVICLFVANLAMSGLSLIP